MYVNTLCIIQSSAHDFNKKLLRCCITIQIILWGSLERGIEPDQEI